MHLLTNQIQFSLDPLNSKQPHLILKSYVAGVSNHLELDKALGELRPPRLRQIIIPTSVSINRVCSSLTVCINECWALVVKG